MSWVAELVLNVHNWVNGVSKVKAATQKTADPLRIGVLAAAAINPIVIIDTTQTHPDATLVGIAARNIAKAEAQIAKYNIGATCKAYGSYDELLADPTIQAVYISTPNGLHAKWALKALEAGKHVLIEKPITSNATEARQIRTAAQHTGKVTLEAFHWRFHPAAHRMRDLIYGSSEKYGVVTHVSAQFHLPQGSLAADDIRLNYSLAGGSCMDLTYAFAACSYFATPDPTDTSVRVLKAKPRLNSNDSRIDNAMVASFVLEQQGRPPVTCDASVDLALPHLFGLIPQIWRASPVVTVQLERAEIVFGNFILPWVTHTITIKEKDADGKLTGKKTVEKCFVEGPIWGAGKGQPWWTTYRYQLEAFVSMVRAREKEGSYQGPWMSLDESVVVMDIIDAVYDKAGMPVRHS